jgi:hypothetical protein
MSQLEPTKVCRSCGLARSLSVFPLQKGGRHGRHPLCKPCRAAQERARYARDRRAILARMRTDEARRRRLRWRSLMRKYGLTQHEYEAMVVWQRGACGVCAQRVTALVVDHDHRSEEVRGLLCPRCNLALGGFDDEVARCDRAAAYLEAQP